MHGHGISWMAILFTAANIAIALGYAAAPVLVLRYLPLTRVVLFWGAVFFLGCAGTHLGMALFIHGHVGLFWTIEHTVQAIGTWGFILTFTRMLRAAASQRLPQTGGGEDR